MGEAFVAGLAFGRMTPSPFSPDEVQILGDVARPVTTAVANALAFEEIPKLRSQLEDENVALREEVAATAAAGGIVGASPGLREVLERVARVAAKPGEARGSGPTHHAVPGRRRIVEMRRRILRGRADKSPRMTGVICRSAR